MSGKPRPSWLAQLQMKSRNLRLGRTRPRIEAPQSVKITQQMLSFQQIEQHINFRRFAFVVDTYCTTLLEYWVVLMRTCLWLCDKARAEIENIIVLKISGFCEPRKKDQFSLPFGFIFNPSNVYKSAKERLGIELQNSKVANNHIWTYIVRSRFFSLFILFRGWWVNSFSNKYSPLFI